MNGFLICQLIEQIIAFTFSEKLPAYNFAICILICVKIDTFKTPRCTNSLIPQEEKIMERFLGWCFNCVLNLHAVLAYLMMRTLVYEKYSP